MLYLLLNGGQSSKNHDSVYRTVRQAYDACDNPSAHKHYCLKICQALCSSEDYRRSKQHKGIKRIIPMKFYSKLLGALSNDLPFHIAPSADCININSLFQTAILYTTRDCGFSFVWRYLSDFAFDSSFDSNPAFLLVKSSDLHISLRNP
jgi:hypothetical protein